VSDLSARCIGLGPEDACHEPGGWQAAP
jgi:hypothetical protein